MLPELLVTLYRLVTIADEQWQRRRQVAPKAVAHGAAVENNGKGEELEGGDMKG